MVLLFSLHLRQERQHQVHVLMTLSSIPQLVAQVCPSLRIQ